MKQDGKRLKGKRESENSFLLRQIRGIVIALASMLGFAFLCSILIWTAVLPEKASDGCVLLCCVMGTLTGGRSVLRKGDKNSVLCGASVGLGLAVICAVSGILLYSSIHVPLCFALGSGCVLSGAVAGSVWVRKGERRRR